MKRQLASKNNWVIISVLGLLFAAIGATIWVFFLMDSAQNYRSPLALTPPTPGQMLGRPVTRRIVIVLIDALRYDTSTNASIMPFLNNIRPQSASATMHSQPPSFSAPGWATILTGAWPYINDGQLFNPPDLKSARPFSQDDIFADAKRAGLKTAVSGVEWFQGLLYNSNVDKGFYTAGEDKTADSIVVEAALPWLTEDYQLILIHLDQVDYAGHHEGGPLNPNWNAAATRSDALLKNIVDTLDLNQDTVLVISDHGQIDRGGHGGPDPVTLVEPFVLAGAGVIPGGYGNVNMVDIAPTLAALLGTSIPSSNQGHVLMDMLALPSDRNLAIQNSLIIQQRQLFTDFTKAISSRINIGQGEIVTATQTALNQAIQARLGSERIWRNMLEVFLAILPGYLLFIRKEKKVLWLMAGAILYIAFFNFRYAVVDGRTYSLASIDGVNWLISYTGTTAVAAALIGWFVPLLGSRAFTSARHNVIHVTLGYVWFIIYILALPILLSFAINGFIVTWILPEWYTMYIGLLSLIQVIFVSLIGLLLTGLLAVFSHQTRNRV
jgi:hypothetical protein